MRGFTAILAAGALTLFAGPLSAAELTLSFDDDGFSQNGTIEQNQDGRAIGTDIDFYGLTGFDTPLNANSRLDCIECKLNFETGPLADSGNIAGQLYWIWENGGSFTLTGELKDSQGMVVASGSLLNGEFTGAGIVDDGGRQFSFTGSGTDSKHEGILNHYGIDADLAHDFRFANTTINLADVALSESGGFRADVMNADLENRAFTEAPEPATLLLIGTGLLAAAGMAARRRAAA